MMLAATSCWQRSHGGLCSERFAGNSRPIRVPWGIYIMVTCLWTCGRVLWIGLRFSGRVDSPWTTLRIAHCLPILSGLSPTGSTALQATDFYILFFLGIVLTKGATSFLKLKIKGPHETKHFLSCRTTIL